jgi:DNA polymerase elongation subunit (family B)
VRRPRLALGVVQLEKDPPIDRLGFPGFHFEHFSLFELLAHCQTHFFLLSADVRTDYATNEQELLEVLAEKVLALDPDVLIGYEVNALSWGYIFERCLKAYGKN